ncbi:MAG: hypothetical protein ACSLE9_20165 [Burkholderiaceae bacterium]
MNSSTYPTVGSVPPPVVAFGPIASAQDSRSPIDAERRSARRYAYAYAAVFSLMLIVLVVIGALL